MVQRIYEISMTLEYLFYKLLNFWIMADSSLGAALTIPKSALDAIEQADKKLKDIQDTAKNTASSVTQSFKDMSVGTKPFLTL